MNRVIAAPTTPRIRVDYTELRRRVEVARRSGDDAARQAALVLASAFTDFVVTVAPKDTNRFVNGFIEAARDIGATGRSPLPIRESRVRKMIEDVLTKQWKRLDTKVVQLETVLDRWYYSKGRTGPWQRRKEVELRRLKRRRERAAEELAKYTGTTGALAVDLFRRRTTGKTQRLATVRTKVYGGSGAVLNAGGRVVVRLHNLEPHASWVERRTRVVARGIGVVRRVGVRRAGRRYLETQAAAGGLRLVGGSVQGRRALPVGFAA